MTIVLIIILVLIVLVVVFAIATYNRLISTRNRVDNAWGDRNLVCSCPPVESYLEAAE